MKIETYIDSLISYGMNCGLAQPEDHQVLQNRLLELLQLDEYIPSDELQSEDLEEILGGLLTYACEKGLCEDNITARDLFDTKIMGLITPIVMMLFSALAKRGKEPSTPRKIGIGMGLAALGFLVMAIGSLG